MLLRESETPLFFLYEAQQWQPKCITVLLKNNNVFLKQFVAVAAPFRAHVWILNTSQPIVCRWKMSGAPHVAASDPQNSQALTEEDI